METQAAYTPRGPDRRQAERRENWDIVDELAATWNDPDNSDPEMRALVEEAIRQAEGPGVPIVRSDPFGAEVRVGSIDRIIDAMEAARRAAEEVMHVACIHVATESWIAVRSRRDLEQIPGPVTYKGQKVYKEYRNVKFVCEQQGGKAEEIARMFKLLLPNEQEDILKELAALGWIKESEISRILGQV